MNTTSRRVNIYRNGELISSQPWVWSEEDNDYFPSEELYCFQEGFNDEINDDTDEVWYELHGLLISEVQDALLFNRTKGSASVASMTYEATVTFTIN